MMRSPEEVVRGVLALVCTCERGEATYGGMSLHFQDFDALCDCGAGVVDDIDHSLWRLLDCPAPRVCLAQGVP